MISEVSDFLKLLTKLDFLIIEITPCGSYLSDVYSFKYIFLYKSSAPEGVVSVLESSSALFQLQSDGMRTEGIQYFSWVI